MHYEGIKKDIADKLDKLLQDVMSDEEFIADCKKDVMILLPMKGDAYLSYLTELQAETQKFFDSTPW